MSGYQIVQTRAIYEGWTKLRVATVQGERGQTIRREIEDHGDAVCVLPYDPSRKTAVLVRQFRAPVYFAADRHETLEAIAGILEESDPAQCARRETDEEAGLALAALEPLFTAWTMPGLSTERLHFFLAIYSETPRSRADIHSGDTDEDVSPVEMDLADLAKMADDGRLPDVKTLLLLQTLRLRKPELFVP